VLYPCRNQSTLPGDEQAPHLSSVPAQLNETLESQDRQQMSGRRKRRKRRRRRRKKKKDEEEAAACHELREG
jgi:hypothetical protein